MISFVVESTVFALLFMGMYHVFFRKDTFFGANRLVLLVTPILTLTLPFLAWEVLRIETLSGQHVHLPTVVLGAESVSNAVKQSPTSFQPTFKLLLWCVYGVGFSFAMGRFIKNISDFQRLKKTSIPAFYHEQHLRVIPESRSAFTALNTIYIGDQIPAEDKLVVIRHEMVHKRDKHGWDLMYFEVLQMLFWFNPLVYYARYQLRVVHEFTADQKTAAFETKTTYTKRLLNQTFETRQFSYANSFFTKHNLKTRLMMLRKTPTNPKAKLKFLILLPLVASMMIWVSCKKNADTTNSKERSDQSDSVTISKEEYRQLKETQKDNAQNSVSKGSTTHRNSEDIVPYQDISIAPQFPKAPEFKNEQEAKSAFEKNIQDFVNDNFDTDKVDTEDLSGMTRINVQFKITKTGEVSDVRAKSENKSLENEAVRVIEMLDASHYETGRIRRETGQRSV